MEVLLHLLIKEKVNSIYFRMETLVLAVHKSDEGVEDPEIHLQVSICLFINFFIVSHCLCFFTHVSGVP